MASQIVTYVLDLVASHPVSLLASVVSTRQVTDQGHHFGAYVSTFELDCPPATAAQDPCQSGGLYPATVVNTQGPLYGGTHIHSGTTTLWNCDVGGPGSSCTSSIIFAGQPPKVTSAAYDACFAASRWVPIVITAGGEKLGTATPSPSLRVEDILSWSSSSLNMLGCPVTTSKPLSLTSSRVSTVTETGGKTTAMTNSGASSIAPLITSRVTESITSSSSYEHPSWAPPPSAPLSTPVQGTDTTEEVSSPTATENSQTSSSAASLAPTPSAVNESNRMRSSDVAAGLACVIAFIIHYLS